MARSVWHVLKSEAPRSVGHYVRRNPDMDGPSDRNCSRDSLHSGALSLYYSQRSATPAYLIRFYRLRRELLSSVAPFKAGSYGRNHRVASLELSFALQKLPCK